MAFVLIFNGSVLCRLIHLLLTATWVMSLPLFSSLFINNLGYISVYNEVFDNKNAVLCGEVTRVGKLTFLPLMIRFLLVCVFFCGCSRGKRTFTQIQDRT